MFPMTMKATEVSLPASRRFSLRHFLSALGLGLVTAATPAQAQVHKCVVDGKVSYQAMPCSAGGGCRSEAVREWWGWQRRCLAPDALDGAEGWHDGG